MEAAARLDGEGIASQVVSMPCWKLFEKQDEKYRNSVIPPQVKARVGIEAATEFGWHHWLGDYGVFVGMTRFGASAPYKAVLQGLRHHDRECRQGRQGRAPEAQGAGEVTTCRSARTDTESHRPTRTLHPRGSESARTAGTMYLCDREVDAGEQLRRQAVLNGEAYPWVEQSGSDSSR